MLMRIAGTVNDSIVDGPGLRFSVFTQGCPHGCPGCQNPETHDPNGGTEADTDDLIAQFAANPLLDGLTLTGGEPFEQPEACIRLARAARAKGLNVWVYSGATYEELLAQNDPGIMQLLALCDVLVDGRYVQSERSLELRFRGSRNQRLIDLPATRRNGHVVCWTPPVW